ncbi:MAG: hypothetical protein H6Q73_2622 [Firmicutes bacterium]|nr:hypothetical protein [Bacillota bacterium]
MKIRTVEYFVGEAASSLRRNSLMSFASVSTVALSLLILGMFLVMVLNLNLMASTLESKVEITVYIQDNLSDHDQREIGTRITKLPGVSEVTFVSKDDALKRFRERLGAQQELLNALGDSNPLPDSFQVKMDKPDLVKTTAQSISEFKGVENAKFAQEVIDQLFVLTRLIRIVGVVLIVFLALAALFIISNTIRITVFARRREIGIMKYVGATDWFIRWPFLFEGMIMGFTGALIAILLLIKAYGMFTHQVYETLAFLPLLPQYPMLTHIGVFLLVIGAVIGALGSTISLRRYMNV